MDEVVDVIRELRLDKIEGAELREDLIAQAFLHPSYCMEHPKGAFADGSQSPYLESNQRLEFLGDAVLGFIAAEYLYRLNPQCQEGELTKQRAALVCEKSLAAAAAVLGLSRWIRLGRGFAASGGAKQPALLADTFEALLAALYLSGATLQALEGFVFHAIDNSRHLVADDADEDYKSQLQAWAQKTKGRKLSYAILDEAGPDHRKTFLAAAYLDEEEVGRGWGNTKQAAQKAAAKLALRKLM